MAKKRDYSGWKKNELIKVVRLLFEFGNSRPIIERIRK